MCRALLSALVMQQYWMGYTSHTVCYYAIGWFSIAHVHHFYEKITHMKMSISSAVANTIIQMSYTSIFGVISSYLLLRTGNVASPIVSHIICNTMGLPDVSFMNSKYSILSFLYSYKYLLLFIHAMGLVLFGMCLFPMTESMAEKSALWIVT
jgi:prenyl protein peptidase